MSPPQSLTIPFEPPLESRLSSDSDLAEQLLQITNQKGLFRNITEQGILAEDSGHDADASEPAPEPQSAEETTQQRVERLWASKESMTKQWSRGLDELLTSLDFLSLLLSKQSAAARANISEGLRAQKVPPGSLEAKIIQAQTPLASHVQRDAEVARGWKAKGFELAHEKFTAASERLKQEAEREALFWAETARLQEDGWKISRHPRDSKAIGIHIGLDASAPHFRSRGFDILRQDDDGRVYLGHQSSLSTSQKRLHIAVEREGRICGSAVSNAAVTSTSSSTSEFAAQARDALLEEELFYEASREARVISKQDIITRAQTIEFSLDQESKVILSYGTHVPQTQLPTQSHDGVAHGIMICLKSLFIEALESKQASRTQRPSPITTRPRPNPELYILRPLITSTRHQAAIDSLQRGMLALFLNPLRRAGLDLDFNIHPTSTSLDENGHPNDRQTRSSHLLPHSRRNVSLLALPDGRNVRIRIQSSLDPPIYGTRYETEPVNFGYAKVARQSLSNEPALLESVQRILTLSVVNVIRTTRPKPANGDWQVEMAQRGELAFIRPGQKRVAALRARVQVLPGMVWLSVASSAAKDLDTGTAGVVRWTWSADRTHVTGNSADVAVKAENLSLLEVVSQLSEQLSS